MSDAISPTIDLSVIIPVYNSERYLRKALDSVLEQKGVAIEIIVVNDGSSGNCREIVEEYAARNKNIRYLSHDRNEGLFRARLTGSGVAGGRYIAFLDSDDYVSADFYRVLFSKAEATNADMVLGPTVEVTPDGKTERNSLLENTFYFSSLEGDAIRERFFSFQGYAYSWQTIWNKIYRKSLWDECVPYFERIQGHLVMTEDLAFSSVLFSRARKLATVRSGCIFYCKHADASTVMATNTLKRFAKNMKDLETVFDFVDAVLAEDGAPEKAKADFREFRLHYCRMYRAIAKRTLSIADNLQAQKYLDSFVPDYKEEEGSDDWFFYTVRAPHLGTLDNIKQFIGNPRFKYISFDVFDTLVYRPFFNPSDLFLLLDKTYEEMGGGTLAFSSMRTRAEAWARECAAKRRGGASEEVTLEEIYASLSDMYGLPQDEAQRLMLEEKRLELRFCLPRAAARELFDVALVNGKKVVLTSDMYLDYETVEAILRKCGYTEYKELFLSSVVRLTKHTGNLYRHVAEKLNVRPEEILHIGDNWNSDVDRAKEKGIEAVFFPKAVDRFRGHVRTHPTNNCSSIGGLACGPVIDHFALERSLGYRTALAMIANKYFDNPYREFHPESDFNIDPYFVGYYPVGMHMLGLTSWLRSRALASGGGRIAFLARDGYLPMRIYRLLEKAVGGPEPVYVQGSRRLLQPGMLDRPTDFYSATIVRRGHSPANFLRLYRPFLKDLPDDEMAAILERRGFALEKPLIDEDRLRSFFSAVIDELYDPERQKEATRDIRQYLEMHLAPDTILFDIGYNGSNPYALSAILERGVRMLYLHTNGDIADTNARRGKFTLECLYPFRPHITGVLREHIYCETGPSCVGLETRDGVPSPVFGEEDADKAAQDLFVVNAIQDGAEAFVRDYLELFSDYLDYMPFKPVEMSMPFEGFLRLHKEVDLRMFKASRFEDFWEYGKHKTSIYDFIRGNTASLAGVRHEAGADSAGGGGGQAQEVSVAHLLRDKSQFSKFLVYYVLDKNACREKVQRNMSSLPFLKRMAVKVVLQFM